jgi:hypothetical protein
VEALTPGRPVERRNDWTPPRERGELYFTAAFSLIVIVPPIKSDRLLGQRFVLNSGQLVGRWLPKRGVWGTKSH